MITRPTTLGVIVGNRGFFPSHLCSTGRTDVLDALERGGLRAVALSADATPYGSVETLTDARACADLFRSHRDEIDGVLVTLPNFGDERAVANTLRWADLDVPVLVHAFADDCVRMTIEQRRDSFCGKMSVCNNLRQYGIPYSLTTLHTVAPSNPSFAEDLRRFAATCRVARSLKHARIGAIGARPAAFNTVRYSEKLFERSGISVETLDLSELLGWIQRMPDSEPAVKAKLAAIGAYTGVQGIPTLSLMKMAKLGVAIDLWMQEKALSATAIQCWTALEEFYGVVPCTLMSMMSESLLPSACETDIAGLLGMYVLQAASEQPAALLDWNNNYGDDPNKGVVFHCSNLPRSFLTISEWTTRRSSPTRSGRRTRSARSWDACRLAPSRTVASRPTTSRPGLRPMSARAASPTTCSIPLAGTASSRCGTSSGCSRRSAVVASSTTSPRPAPQSPMPSVTRSKPTWGGICTATGEDAGATGDSPSSTAAATAECSSRSTRPSGCDGPRRRDRADRRALDRTPSDRPASASVSRRRTIRNSTRTTTAYPTSPTIENLLGPSRTPFKPGTLDGVRDPQIEQRSSPYKADLVNPAPNVGFAWSPEPEGGVLGKLFGNGKSVIRASAGVNYYDEGLIAFQASAGGNPGLTQSLTLNPGQPGFAPGGLSLSSPIPALSTFPTSFQFPLAESLFTFARGFNSIDPDIRTPYILNWSIGLQRELAANAAFEARYVGNHGFKLWRYYDLNEVNIIENGFVQEFRNAQKNLDINIANGRAGFANNALPGQVPLPIFEAAFGARGSQAALPAASGYTNGTFLTLLQQGQAGALANALAGQNGASLYLCRLLGSTFSPCGALGYDAPGPYPINFFQGNPFAAGRANNLLTDDGWSRYHGLQLQYRQRYGQGLTVTSNYTYSRARTNRYSDASSTLVTLVTRRDDSRNETPGIFDLRHAFQSYWTYELPWGPGRAFAIENPVLSQVAGGWAVSGIARIQSGRPFFLTSGRSTYNQYDAGVVLNGMSVDELQKLVTLGPGPNGTKLYVDPKLIGPDGRANPQYLLSPTTPGDLGQRIFLYGPGFWNLDLSVAKRFSAGHAYVTLEALFLDLFNHTTFLVGGTNNDAGFPISINSTTFGQTTNTASGPRNIQLRLLIGW